MPQAPLHRPALASVAMAALPVMRKNEQIIDITTAFHENVCCFLANFIFYYSRVGLKNKS